MRWAKIKRVNFDLINYKRLDNNRWDGVPITFETTWVEPDNYFFDVRTSIMVHDILEREFNIDIDDRKILLTSIRDCVGFIMDNHSSI